MKKDFYVKPTVTVLLVELEDAIAASASVRAFDESGDLSQQWEDDSNDVRIIDIN